ncbi:MAG: ABC transporter permease [Undibacterium sp.]|nr:ABC transporter permease [Undibacterium sp.]
MLKNYFQIAWKVYLRRKMFTAINLLCIVLTLAVLLVVTAILQHLFFPTGVEGKSERFLQVGQMFATGTGPKGGERTQNSPLGYKIIDQYLRKMKSVEKVAAVTSFSPVSIYQNDRVTEISMRRADAEYWEILDFKVLAGRVPNREDVAQGRFVAVLNLSTAKKLFGDGAVEKNVVGQKLNAGGQQFEVIGVVADEIHINAYSDMWVPVTTFPSSDYKTQIWGSFAALMLAKSKADLPLIQSEIQQVATSIVQDDPSQYQHTYLWANSKLDTFARDILQRRTEVDSGGRTLLIRIGIVMLIFMVLPALNLVNLNTGRMMERSAEIGIRKAFGASSLTLVGQFIVENILLSLFGAVLALICAEAVLMAIAYSGLIPYLNIDLNLAVFAYGSVFAVVFGLLSGVIPAWKMSRLNPVLALKGVA